MLRPSHSMPADAGGAIRLRCGDTPAGRRCIRRSSRGRSHVRASSFPQQGGGRSLALPASSVLRNAPTSRHSSRRASFPSLGGTTDASGVRSRAAADAPPRGRGVVVGGHPMRRRCAVEMAGSPKFPQNPLSPRTCSFDPGRTGRNSPYLAPTDAATAKGTTVTSSIGLSRLNRMARRLAVYASPWRSPDTTQDSLAAAG